MLGDTPLSGYSVDFWDKTQDDMFIGTAVTDIFGFATYIYETNTTTVAGPHLIYANYGARYNYSYFIIDEPISINLDISPIPSIINRSGSIGRTFNIHGYINDSLNGANPKFCEISVHLYNGATYVDSQLELITGSLQLGTSGEIDLIYRVKTNTNVQNYSIEVWFNGTFLYWNPYGIDNPHNFNQIQSISSNFTFSAICSNQLEVRDPEDIVILLTIDGNPALPIYNDLNLPERYNGGETINFQVQVNWSGNYAQSGDVKIYDFDNATNFELDSHTFIPADNGYWSFSIDTTGWHAGLHYIKVNWSGSIYPNSNTTYIIINKIVSITANSPVPNVVLRDSDSFTVSGTVQDGVTLRGLEVTIVLYDITMNNLSNYLNVQGGSRTILINPDGTFLFTINSIDLNCPHGTYYIRIDFNGSLYDFDTAIDITDYMIHASSSLRTFNITADTSIINANFNTTVDDTWYDGDTLWTWGNLIWDNLSSINSVQVNVSVKDGSGTLLASNTDFTDGSGNFLINITVDSSWVWGDTYVYVNFFPEDSFSDPDYYYIYDVTNQLVLRAP